MEDKEKARDELIQEIESLRSQMEGLRREVGEWQKVFDLIPVLVFIEDNSNTIIRLNRAFADAFKLRPEDIIGKKPYEIFQKLDKLWPNCPWLNAKGDKQPHTAEVNGPGSDTSFSVTITPIFGEDGEYIGAIHVAADISENVKIKKELKNKIHEVEKFSTAVISRELKMIELKKKIKKLEISMSHI